MDSPINTIGNPSPAPGGHCLGVAGTPRRRLTLRPAQGPVSSPEPQPPRERMLGRSSAHSNPSSPVFVPSHRPGLCFLPLLSPFSPPFLFLLSTHSQLPAHLRKPKLEPHRPSCQPGDALSWLCPCCQLSHRPSQEHIWRRWPRAAGLGFRFLEKPWRSWRALEPAT